MTTAATAPAEVDRPDLGESADTARVWITIVWNDPVNLMSYVTFIFQKLFGYSREKATRLMLQVHHEGRAVVACEPREKAEWYVYRLHEYGLQATLAPS